MTSTSVTLMRLSLRVTFPDWSGLNSSLLGCATLRLHRALLPESVPFTSTFIPTAWPVTYIMTAAVTFAVWSSPKITMLDLLLTRAFWNRQAHVPCPGLPSTATAGSLCAESTCLDGRCKCFQEVFAAYHSHFKRFSKLAGFWMIVQGFVNHLSTHSRLY